MSVPLQILLAFQCIHVITNLYNIKDTATSYILKNFFSNPVSYLLVSKIFFFFILNRMRLPNISDALVLCIAG